MISFLPEMVAYGQTLATLPAFLEAVVVPFDVPDVASQFF